MVESSESYPVVTDDAIRIVETRLGFALPEDLKSFYFSKNGGKPSCDVFIKDDEYYEVHTFLPMNSGSRDIGFEETYEDLVVNNIYFPKEVIPFAIDPGGDHFLYSLKPNNFGHILMYQSDYYDDPERAIVDLADNLNTFIDSLQCVD